MRMIDADALINELNNNRYPGAPYVDAGISIAIGKVCDAPTIEHKTGKWIETDSHEPCWFKCDQCGRLSDIKEIYCPTCGASMVNTTCRADMRGGNEQ